MFTIEKIISLDFKYQYIYVPYILKIVEVYSISNNNAELSQNRLMI